MRNPQGRKQDPPNEEEMFPFLDRPILLVGRYCPEIFRGRMIAAWAARGESRPCEHARLRSECLHCRLAARAFLAQFGPLYYGPEYIDFREPEDNDGPAHG